MSRQQLADADISEVGPGAYAAHPEVFDFGAAACSERASLDIDMLSRRYKRLKERQRQAHVILAVANNNKNHRRPQPQSTASNQQLVTAIAPIERLAVVNHLFISSDLCVQNRNRAVVKAPTIASTFYGQTIANTSTEHSRTSSVSSHSTCQSIPATSSRVSSNSSLNQGVTSPEKGCDEVGDVGRENSSQCNNVISDDAPTKQCPDSISSHCVGGANGVTRRVGDDGGSSGKIESAVAQKKFNPFPKQHFSAHRSRSGVRLRLYSLTGESSSTESVAVSKRRPSYGDICSRQRNDVCLREMSNVSK